MKLATEEDVRNLQAAIKIVEEKETTDQSHIDWENIAIQTSIRRVIHNLENFENYFKKLPETEKKWFDAECDNCGWFGSSEFLNGGGQIADTGDCDDCTCPVCGEIAG